MTPFSTSDFAAMQARVAAARKTKNPAQSPSEAEALPVEKEERELHRQFEQWLNLNGIHFIHFRMDKKSPLPGLPDFTCHRDNKVCFVEFKAAGELPTEEQTEYIARLRAINGCEVVIASDLALAIQKTKERLL
jgi:hypothetical protein